MIRLQLQDWKKVTYLPRSSRRYANINIKAEVKFISTIMCRSIKYYYVYLCQLIYDFLFLILLSSNWNKLAMFA